MLSTLIAIYIIQVVVVAGLLVAEEIKSKSQLKRYLIPYTWVPGVVRLIIKNFKNME